MYHFLNKKKKTFFVDLCKIKVKNTKDQNNVNNCLQAKKKEEKNLP